MSAWRSTYKVLRSILFTTIMTVVGIYLVLYVVVSIPLVQDSIKSKVETELGQFLKTKVRIGQLQIIPFNELRVKNLIIYSPDGKECVKAETLGAGIRLWRFISTGIVEITYAELVGFDAHITKESAESPLNIDFIIKAFQPKEKKAPKQFDVNIYNIVIRKSALSFDKLWIPKSNDTSRIDYSHLRISDLKADIILPKLKNDDFTIDLRRLSFKEKGGLNVNKISFYGHITANKLDIKDFLFRTEGSTIEIPSVCLTYPSYKDIKESLYENIIPVTISGMIHFPDFKTFIPAFSKFPGSYMFDIVAEGNISSLRLNKFLIKDKSNDFNLNMSGIVGSLTDASELYASVDRFNVEFSRDFIDALRNKIFINNPVVRQYLGHVGKSTMQLSGDFSRQNKTIKTDFKVDTECGSIGGNIDALFNGMSMSLGDMNVSADLSCEELNLGRILESPKFGEINFCLQTDLSLKEMKVDGNIDLSIGSFMYNGHQLENISLYAEKDGDDISASAVSDNNVLNFSLNADATVNGLKSSFIGDVDIANISLSKLGFVSNRQGEIDCSGRLSVSLEGNNIDDLIGGVSAHDISISLPDKKKLDINYFAVSSSVKDSLKHYTLNSDFISGELNGSFKFNHISKIISGIVARSFPSIGEPYYSKTYEDNLNLKLAVRPDDIISDFFNLPIRPGVDIEITGTLDARSGTGNVSLNAPYLIQGKNKLIKNTNLNLRLDSNKGLSGTLKTDFPMKNDRADLSVSVTTFNDNISANTSWSFQNNKTATGEIKITSHLSKNPISGKLEMFADVVPTSFHLNGADWQIGGSQLYYSNKYVKINDLKIWHGDQYVNVNGVASVREQDMLRVDLKDINLNYIFDTLNINYVTFGGDATGVLSASSIFSDVPVLHTDFLKVKNLSYNNTVLGDADLVSYFDNIDKMVAIKADIKKGENSRARVDGGIYVTRDSLSLNIEAEHVDLKVIKPFMEGFTSDVGGLGSCDMKLFGSFKDIDLVGRAFADSICMKVDYTNVYYHASDSVLFKPGMIVIPKLNVYDKYGNSAELTGYVKHRYFHEPEFRFDLTNAKHILCYDTNASMNPDWYGHVFASGNGSLVGWPGVVRLMLDVSTDQNSSFTFALNDTQIASEYNFLTFKDRDKVETEEIEIEDNFESRFLSDKISEEEQNNSLFDLDLRCTISEQAALNLIMDPKAGDKIIARGNGAMQIGYNTSDDEMKIYGKYILSEGTYNFSLQDLILRDFSIRQGSSIAFNGDVMKGVLDIVAAYRVNTNLSDIDKSFSTDKDLNRTSVPVDALLKVDGEFTHPNISFDIALPTLTEEVERKVKSIISTEDMMNRQIIYLLALNRFYTPEYMGATSNGSAELASVASSTVSSQLSNFLGQLTDKFTLVPSFRSDKGDFSDMEVDVALSSKLLNNRLMINGNFGYRDKATSTTTFIGDFDIEYLLNKNGNLRLKAYNHFNDQYYYLQSATTTQGIGVVYRRDFDNPFTFLRRKKKISDKASILIMPNRADSIK